MYIFLFSNQPEAKDLVQQNFPFDITVVFEKLGLAQENYTIETFFSLSFTFLPAIRMYTQSTLAEKSFLSKETMMPFSLFLYKNWDKIHS